MREQENREGESTSVEKSPFEKYIKKKNSYITKKKYV